MTFGVGRTVFDTATATDNELTAAVFVIHVFTTHKNDIWGDKIGHGATGDPYCAQMRRCVVKWPIYNNMAPPLTPLSPVLICLGEVGKI